MEKFSDWLFSQMKAQKMGQAELAKKSGLSSATISRLLNDSRQPGSDACNAIARALGLPADAVFRAAGQLPETPTPRGLYEEIIQHRLTLLSARELEEVYKFTDYLLSKKGD